MEKDYGFDTLMVHAGFDCEEGTKVNIPPIYMSNAYRFDSTEHARKLFDLSEEGNIYSRMMNPTVDVFEKRVTALEGGAAACAFSSGHSAIALTMLTLCDAGDEIVSSSCIYGGAINLFGQTFARYGIKANFVDIDKPEQIEAAINDRTKCIFAETIGNPNANVADIEMLAQIAHRHGLPLIIDSTFTSPYLINPIKHGADIVIHSATKCINGHGNSMGGIVVDSGKFNWAGNPRFRSMNEPDASYHGKVFATDFGNVGFITKLRVLMLRDFGSCMSAFNAYMMILGLETLSLRMRKHSDNARDIALFLKSDPRVAYVNYAAFRDNKYYPFYKKYYAEKGLASVFTFGLKASREKTGEFIDNLQLIQNVANVCDARTLIIHPATTTHSQLSPEQLRAGGIDESTIRLSAGLEDVKDIIADISQALDKVLGK